MDENKYLNLHHNLFWWVINDNYDICFTYDTISFVVKNFICGDISSEPKLPLLNVHHSYLQLKFEVGPHGLKDEEAESHGGSKQRDSLRLKQLHY